MSTESQGVPSAQRGQRPEQVTPRARADASAELGAEGGSYGDLTQNERAERLSDRTASGRQFSWGTVLAGSAAVLLVIAAILAVIFWAAGA